MSQPAREVDCDRHGRRPAALCCRHVATGSGRGFYTTACDDMARPQAWCASCDARLRRAGAWTDELFREAEIALVCAECWDGARARNRDGSPLRRAWRALVGR